MREISTVSEAIDYLGMGRAQWLLLLYTSAAWAADACETMLLSFLGPSIRCYWPSQVGPFRESLLTSVVFLGMLGGVYSLGVVSDSFGRRQGFFLSALILGVAGLASSLAPSYIWLLLLRATVGAALGGTPIALTLFAEWAPPSRRGSLILLLQAAWTVGTVFEACIAWLILPRFGWRWLLVISAAPMLLLLFAYPFIPETPYWLISRGKYEEAEIVIKKVAQFNQHYKRDQHPQTATVSFALKHHYSSRRSRPQQSLQTNESDGECAYRNDESEVHSIFPQQHPQNQNARNAAENAPLHSPSSNTPWFATLKHSMAASFKNIFAGYLLWTTCALWIVWFVNAITYYGLVLLTTALSYHPQSIQEENQQRCTEDGKAVFTPTSYATILITSLAEAPGIAAAALLVDSKGRLWCLRGGMILCALCLLCLPLAADHLWPRTALLFAARAIIEGTFSVLYIYTPELYSTSVRSFGLALCNGFSRMGGLAAPFVTVWMVEHGHAADAGMVMAGLCMLATAAAFSLRYETQGRDLEEDTCIEGSVH